jgi:hypothetical protein
MSAMRLGAYRAGPPSTSTASAPRTAQRCCATRTATHPQCPRTRLRNITAHDSANDTF